jgi:3'(2'), 5'-bisphosphate nucleotidase
MENVMSEFEHERAVALAAARLAGRLCLAIRQDMDNPVEKMDKAGKEPVTIADYGAQAIILHHIAAKFPEDATLAEERGQDFDALSTDRQRAMVLRYVSDSLEEEISLDQLRSWIDHGRDVQSSRTWVIDPIDGTKGFLRGDQFAVAVALLIEGEPVVGALACPALPFNRENRQEGPEGVVAIAVRGAGAMLEPMSSGQARYLRVSPNAQLELTRSVESLELSSDSFTSEVFRSIHATAETVRMDSQAKYVAVADGRAEAYLRQSRGADYREKVWDHAAGVLLVEEAGGRVTDLRGNRLDFTQGTKLENNYGVLATNGHVHDAVLQGIRDIDSQ